MTNSQTLAEVFSHGDLVDLKPLMRLNQDDSNAVVLDVWNGVSQWGDPHNINDVLGSLDAFTAALETHGLSVQTLKLGDSKLDGKTLEAIATWRGFPKVKSLDYGGNRISAKALGAVASRGASLERLNLDFVKVGKSIAKLAGAPKLRRLSLAFADIDTSILALIADTNLPALSELSLDGFGQYATWKGYDQKLADGRLQFLPANLESLAPILTEEQRTRWTSLTLGHVELVPDGFQNVSLPNLAALDLMKVKAGAAARNSVGAIDMPKLQELVCDGGLPFECLENAVWLPHLQELRFNGVEYLDDTELGAVLAKAGSLAKLWIERAGAMGETARGIASAGAPIEELRLMWNYLRDEDVAHLAEGWEKTPPKVIGLTGNQLTKATIELAVEHADTLVGLGFGYMEIEDDDVLPILNAELPNLQLLGLAGNRLSDVTAGRVMEREWHEAKLFLESNCLSRTVASELKRKFGSRVPNVDRQYDHKLNLARAPLVDGFRGVKLVGCEVQPPWPESPKPEVEGVVFPDDALRWKPVGTRGSGAECELVFTVGNSSTKIFEAIELEEPLKIADGSTFLQADGAMGAGGAVAAVAGGLLVNVTAGYAGAPPNVRNIGECRAEVYALAYDGQRLVVADGDANSEATRVRYFRYLGDNNVWSWHLQDTLEVAYKPGSAFFPQEISAVVFGPKPGEFGKLWICAVLGWGVTLSDGPAFLHELASVGPEFSSDRGMVVDREGRGFSFGMDQRVAQKLYKAAKAALPSKSEVTRLASERSENQSKVVEAVVVQGPKLWTEANDWYESSVWNLEVKFVEEPTSEQRVAVALALRNWVAGTAGLFESSAYAPVWSGKWTIVQVEERSFMTDAWSVRDAIGELGYLVNRLHHVHPIAEAVFLECTSHGNPDIPSDGPLHPDPGMMHVLEAADATYDRSRDESLPLYATDPMVDEAWEAAKPTEGVSRVQ